MSPSYVKKGGALLGLILGATLRLAPCAIAGEGPHGPRAFVVKDAIERSTIDGFGEQELQPSPDQRQLAFVTSKGDLGAGVLRSTVWLIRQDKQGKFGAFPVTDRSSRINQTAIASLRWVDEGRALAFLSPDDKGLIQVFRYDLRARKTEQVTKVDANVVKFDLKGDMCVFFAVTSGSPDYPAPGGYLKDESLSRLIFADEDKFGEKGAAYAQKMHGKARQITAPSVNLLRQLVNFVISPDRASAVAILPAAKPDADFLSAWGGMAGAPKLIHDIPNMALQPYLIRLSDGAIQPLLSAPTASAAGMYGSNQIAWSEDGKRILLSNVLLGPKDLAPGQHPVATSQDVEIVLGTSKAVHIIPADDERQAGERISQFSWMGPNDISIVSAAGAGGGEGYSSLLTQGRRWQSMYRRDGDKWAKASRDEIALAPRRRIGDVEFFVEENANLPPRLVGQEIGTSRRTFELDPNPQLASVRLLPIRPVSWKDREGHEWSGGLILPVNSSKASGPIPVVVELKFFDPSRFSPDGPYTTAFASQALAAKGIAVLEVNAIDQPTYGTRQEGPMQLRGIESAVDFLVAQHNIDPDRVGLLGFSRTCYYVSYALTHSARRFAAATLADGLSGGYIQYHAFSLNHSPGHGLKPNYDQWNGGPPWGASLANWVKDSPDMNASKFSAPVRIEMLSRYSVLQEWEIYSTLKLQDKPVDALYLPDATHVLVKPRERYLSQQGNVNWFSFWLLGEAGKDQDSQADYQRWEPLKAKR